MAIEDEMELETLLAEAESLAPQIDPERFAHDQVGWYSNDPFNPEVQPTSHPSGYTVEELNQFMAGEPLRAAPPNPWFYDGLPGPMTMDDSDVDPAMAMQELTDPEVAQVIDQTSNMLSQHMRDTYGIEFTPSSTSTQYTSKWDTWNEIKRMWTQLGAQDEYVKGVAGDQTLEYYRGFLQYAKGLLFRPKTIATYSDVQGVGDALEYAGGAFGNALPTMVQSAATAGAGGLVGGGIGALLGPAGAAAGFAAGSKIGAGAGAIAGSWPSNTALWYYDELMKGHNEPEIAAAVGVPVAALDALVPGAFGKAFAGAVKSVATRKSAKQLREELAKKPKGVVKGKDGKIGVESFQQHQSRSLPSHMARGAAAGSPVEGITEALQESIQNVAHKYVAWKRDGVPIEWTNEDWQILIDAGLSGMIAGGGMGAGTGALNYVSDRAQRGKWEQVDPTTGQPSEAPGTLQTGLVDPQTGQPIDPKTGQPYPREDPATPPPDGGPTPPPSGGGEGAAPATAPSVPPSGEDTAPDTTTQQPGAADAAGTQAPTTPAPPLSQMPETAVEDDIEATAEDILTEVTGEPPAVTPSQPPSVPPQEGGPRSRQPNLVGQRVSWNAYDDSGEGVVRSVDPDAGVVTIIDDATGQQVDVYDEDTQAGFQPIQAPTETPTGTEPTETQPDTTPAATPPVEGDTGAQTGTASAADLMSTVDDIFGTETPPATAPQTDDGLGLPTGQQPPGQVGDPLASGEADAAPPAAKPPSGRPTGARDPNAPTLNSGDDVEYGTGDKVRFTDDNGEEHTGTVVQMDPPRMLVRDDDGQEHWLNPERRSAEGAQDGTLSHWTEQPTGTVDDGTIGGALGATTEPAGPLDVAPTETTEKPKRRTRSGYKPPRIFRKGEELTAEEFAALKPYERENYINAIYHGDPYILAKDLDNGKITEGQARQIIEYLQSLQQALVTTNNQVLNNAQLMVDAAPLMSQEERDNARAALDLLHQKIQRERDTVYTALIGGHTVNFVQHPLALEVKLEELRHFAMEVQSVRATLDRQSLETIPRADDAPKPPSVSAAKGMQMDLTEWDGMPDHFIVWLVDWGARLPGLEAQTLVRNVIIRSEKGIIQPWSFRNEDQITRKKDVTWWEDYYEGLVLSQPAGEVDPLPPADTNAAPDHRGVLRRLRGFAFRRDPSDPEKPGKLTVPTYWQDSATIPAHHVGEQMGTDRLPMMDLQPALRAVPGKDLQAALKGDPPADEDMKSEENRARNLGNLVNYPADAQAPMVLWLPLRRAPQLPFAIGYPMELADPADRPQENFFGEPLLGAEDPDVEHRYVEFRTETRDEIDTPTGPRLTARGRNQQLLDRLGGGLGTELSPHRSPSGKQYTWMEYAAETAPDTESAERVQAGEIDPYWLMEDESVEFRYERAIPEVTSSYRGFPVHIRRFESIEQLPDGRWKLTATRTHTDPEGDIDETFEFYSQENGTFWVVARPEVPDGESMAPYPEGHTEARRIAGLADYELGTTERRTWKWSIPRGLEAARDEQNVLEEFLDEPTDAERRGTELPQSELDRGIPDWLPVIHHMQVRVTARAEMDRRTTAREKDYKGTVAAKHKNTQVGDEIVYPRDDVNNEMTTGVIIRKGNQQTVKGMLDRLTRGQRSRVMSGTKLGQRRAEQTGMSFREQDGTASKPKSKRQRLYDRAQEASNQRYVTVVNLDTGRRHVLFSDFNLNFHVIRNDAEIELDADGMPILEESAFDNTEAWENYQTDREHDPDLDTDEIAPLTPEQQSALQDQLDPAELLQIAHLERNIQPLPDDELAYQFQQFLMKPDLTRSAAWDRLMRETYQNEIQRRDTQRLAWMDRHPSRRFSANNLARGDTIWVFSLSRVQGGVDADKGAVLRPVLAKVQDLLDNGQVTVRFVRPYPLQAGGVATEATATPDFDDFYYVPDDTEAAEQFTLVAPAGAHEVTSPPPKPKKPNKKMPKTDKGPATVEDLMSTVDDIFDDQTSGTVPSSVAPPPEQTPSGTGADVDSPAVPKRKPRKKSRPKEAPPPGLSETTNQQLDDATKKAQAKARETFGDNSTLTNLVAEMREIMKGAAAEKEENLREQRTATAPEPTVEDEKPPARVKARWIKVSAARGVVSAGDEVWFHEPPTKKTPGGYSGRGTVTGWYGPRLGLSAGELKSNAFVQPVKDADRKTIEQEQNRIQRMEAIHGKSRTWQDWMGGKTREYADGYKEAIAPLSPEPPGSKRYMVKSLDQEADASVPQDAALNRDYTDEQYQAMKQKFDIFAQEVKVDILNIESAREFIIKLKPIVEPFGPTAVNMLKQYLLELHQQAQQPKETTDGTGTKATPEGGGPGTDSGTGTTGSPDAPQPTPPRGQPDQTVGEATAPGTGKRRDRSQSGSGDGGGQGDSGVRSEDVIHRRAPRERARASDTQRLATTHQFTDEEIEQNRDATVPAARLSHNRAALALLVDLERKQAYPNTKEAEILARFSGWGGLEPYVWGFYLRLTKDQDGKRVTIPYGMERDADLRATDLQDLLDNPSDEDARKWHEWLAGVDVPSGDGKIIHRSGVFELLQPKDVQELYPFIARNRNLDMDTYKRLMADTTATPLPVAQYMWRLMQATGFTQGSVLDFGFGTGAIAGTQPSELREFSSIMGIDMDPVSARMAYKLFASAHLQREKVGYSIPAMPAGSVPAVVTELDQQTSPQGVDLDYGTVEGNRLVDVVRALQPGGVAVVLANSQYMDASTPHARRELADLAYLTSIVRFNTNAYSGANAVRDLLVFRRKKPGDMFEDPQSQQPIDYPHWAIPRDLWAEPERTMHKQKVARSTTRGTRRARATTKQVIEQISPIPKLLRMAQESREHGSSVITYRDMQAAKSAVGASHAKAFEDEAKWALDEAELEDIADNDLADPKEREEAQKELDRRSRLRDQRFGPKRIFQNYHTVHWLPTPTDPLPTYNNAFTRWYPSHVQEAKDDFQQEHGAATAPDQYVQQLAQAVQSVQDHLSGIKIHEMPLHQVDPTVHGYGLREFDLDRRDAFELYVETDKYGHTRLNQRDQHNRPLVVYDSVGRVKSGALILDQKWKNAALDFVAVRDKIHEIIHHETRGDMAAADQLRGAAKEAYDRFTKQHGHFWSRKIVKERVKPDVVIASMIRRWNDVRNQGVEFNTGSYDLNQRVKEILEEQTAQRLEGMAEEDLTPTLDDAAALKLYKKAMSDFERKAKPGEEWDWGDFDAQEAENTERFSYPIMEAFEMDPSFRRVATLVENVQYSADGRPENDTFTDGDILSEPVLRVEERQPPTEIFAALEYHEKVLGGPLNIAELARHTNLTIEEAVQQLGDRIFRVPGPHEIYETPRMYLTGDVQEKLDEARKWADSDPQYERNVTALEEALPAPIKMSDIETRLGAPWITIEDMYEFLMDAYNVDASQVEKLGIEHHYVTELADNYTTSWPQEKDVKAADRSLGHDNLVVMAEIRKKEDEDKFEQVVMPSDKLIGHVLNGTYPKIKSWETDPVLNKLTQGVHEEATAAVRDAIDDIHDTFNRWVQGLNQHPRAEMQQTYKEIEGRMNEYVNRFIVRDDQFWQELGNELYIPGLARKFEPRGYQNKVTARMLHEPTYLAHAVGAGKTMSIAASVMRSRQLGLVRKPLIVVHRSTLGSFSLEFQKNFPSARILVGTPEIYGNPDKRRFFEIQAAQGDWDAIIIDQPGFEHMNVTSDAARSVNADIYESLANYPAPLQERKGPGARVAKWEKTNRQVYARHGNQLMLDRMGIDHLIIDEAHLYRKMNLYTNHGAVRGVTADGSSRAARTYAMMRYVQSVNPRNPVHLASGTPVTNTLGEVYTIPRFLARKRMESMGILSFDSWVRVFSGITIHREWKMNTLKEQTSLRNVRNVSHINRFHNTFIDYMNGDMVRNQIAAEGKQRLPVLHEEKHVFQRTLNQEKQQYDAILREVALKNKYARGGMLEAADRYTGDRIRDIILSIWGDLSNSAFDPRVVDPNAPKEQTKLEGAIENIAKIWHEEGEQDFKDIDGNVQLTARPGQIVFVDTAKWGTRRNTAFRSQEYIRDQLIERGVPAERIALYEDHKKNTVSKQALFNAVNSGQINILIGHTKEMGIGVNVQKVMKHGHFVDPQILPADHEQAEGRFFRAGNLNTDIYAHHYVTVDTQDAVILNNRHIKKTGIDAMMDTRYGTGQASVAGDTVEDIEETAPSSVLSVVQSDTRVAEQRDLQEEVRKLRTLQHRSQDMRGRLEKDIERDERDQATMQKNLFPKYERDFGPMWRGRPWKDNTDDLENREALAAEKLRDQLRRGAQEDNVEWQDDALPEPPRADASPVSATSPIFVDKDGKPTTITNMDEAGKILRNYIIQWREKGLKASEEAIPITIQTEHEGQTVSRTSILQLRKDKVNNFWNWAALVRANHPDGYASLTPDNIRYPGVPTAFRTMGRRLYQLTRAEYDFANRVLVRRMDASLGVDDTAQGQVEDPNGRDIMRAVMDIHDKQRLEYAMLKSFEHALEQRLKRAHQLMLEVQWGPKQAEELVQLEQKLEELNVDLSRNPPQIVLAHHLITADVAQAEQWRLSKSDADWEDVQGELTKPNPQHPGERMLNLREGQKLRYLSPERFVTRPETRDRAAETQDFESVHPAIIHTVHEGPLGEYDDKGKLIRWIIEPVDGHDIHTALILGVKGEEMMVQMQTHHQTREQTLINEHNIGLGEALRHQGFQFKRRQQRTKKRDTGDGQTIAMARTIHDVDRTRWPSPERTMFAFQQAKRLLDVMGAAMLPEHTQIILEHSDEYAASYDGELDIIHIALNGVRNIRQLRHRFHHEAVHAIFGRLPPEAVKRLRKLARDEWIDQHDIRKHYPNLWDEALEEEAIAEAFVAWLESGGRARVRDKAESRADMSTFQRIFEMIRDFLQRVGELFQGMGWKNVDEVFWGMASGNYSGKTPAARYERHRRMAKGMDDDAKPNPDPAAAARELLSHDLMEEGKTIDDALETDEGMRQAKSFSNDLYEKVRQTFNRNREQEIQDEEDADRSGQERGTRPIGRKETYQKSDTGTGSVHITGERRDLGSRALLQYFTLPEWTFAHFPDLQGVVQQGARSKQDYLAYQGRMQKELDRILDGRGFTDTVARLRASGETDAADALAADLSKGALTETEAATAHHVRLQYDAEGIEPTLAELQEMNLNPRQIHLILDVRRYLDKIGRYIAQHEHRMEKNRKQYLTYLMEHVSGIVAVHSGLVDGEQFRRLMRMEDYWKRHLDRLQYDPNATIEDFDKVKQKLWGHRHVDLDAEQETHTLGVRAEIQRVVDDIVQRSEQGSASDKYAARSLVKMLGIARDQQALLRNSTFIRRREGYAPHIFNGSWRVYQWNGDTKPRDPATGEKQWSELTHSDSGFFRNKNEAKRYALRQMQRHPNHEFRIVPLQGKPHHMQAEPLMVHTYTELMRKVAQAIGDPEQQRVPGLEGMSHGQLQELLPQVEHLINRDLDPTADVNQRREMITEMFRPHARRMIFGARMHRAGHPGFMRAQRETLSLHMQAAVRYVTHDPIKFAAVKALQKRELDPENMRRGEPEIAGAFRNWLNDYTDQIQPFESRLTAFLQSPLSKHLSQPMNFALKSGLLMGALAGTVGAAAGGLAAGGVVGLITGSVYGAFGLHAALHTSEEFQQRRTAAGMSKLIAHAKLGLFTNIAAAFVNLSQTAINTYPVVGWKHLSGGVQDYISAKAGTNPGLRRWLEKTGIPFETGYDEVLHLSGFSRGRVERMSMFAFHEAEIFNRGIAYFAAFRQSQEQHPNRTAKEHDDYAMKIVLKTQHDYTNAGKPMLLRLNNMPARAATQFMNFMIQQAGFWLGLASGSRADKIALAKSMLMLFIITGITGQPIAQLFGAMVGALMGDENDPVKEIEQWLLEQIATGDILPADLAWLLLSGFPAAVAGVDTSQRIGAGRHFIPQSPWGPMINTMQRVGDQVQQESDFSQIGRSLAPGFGNPLWAWEAYSTGLVPAPAGDTLYADPDTDEVMKMALGFMPTRTSYAYRKRSLIYDVNESRTLERKALGNMLERSIRRGEPIDRQRIVDAVMEHKLSNPGGSIRDAVRRVLIPELNSLRGLDKRDYPEYLKLQPTR